MAALHALLKGGADPLATMTIWDNPTALWRAVVSSQTNAVLVLLQAGVDINLPHRNGLVVLHGAGAFGQPEMVRFLIDHGADREHTNSDGQTPLAIAVGHDMVANATALLEKGAKLSSIVQRDASGRTTGFKPAPKSVGMVRLLEATAQKQGVPLLTGTTAHDGTRAP